MHLPIREFCGFLYTAYQHYEKSAPAVSEYLDDLYQRMGEAPHAVTLDELNTASALLEDGNWEQPNYAANRFYKLAARHGRDTTGLAGF